MAHSRRQFREMEVLAVLIAQGSVIPCKRCRVAFTAADLAGKSIQKEHLHERALDGPDEPDNCAFSHTDCHLIITNGTGATTAGSSKNRIAKATQPKRIEKFHINKPPLDRPAIIDPGVRCRRCGEYGDDCICPPIQNRSSFAQARRT